MPNPFLALDATTSIQIGDVQVWDEGATPESMSAGNPSATRTLVCAWADRLRLAIALGGGVDPKTGVYSPPKPHPLYQWLWVSDVSVSEGIPGPNGPTCDTVNGQQIIGYHWCRCRVSFTRPAINPLNITRGDLRMRRSVELIAPSRDKATLQFADGTPVSPAITPAVRVAKAEFTLTRYNLTGLPLSILNLESCVNADWFDFTVATCTPLALGLTNLIANTPGIAGTRCPPGTLLFDGVETDKPITFGGNDQITAVFSLLYRACGWNRVWNDQTGKFETVYSLQQSATTTSSSNGSGRSTAGGAGTAADPYSLQLCVYISGAQPPQTDTTPTPGNQLMYPPADFSPLYGLL